MMRKLFAALFAAHFALVPASAFAQSQAGTFSPGQAQGNGTGSTSAGAPTLVTSIINAACSVSPSACGAMFGYYKPSWYGAVGDGIANDTTAIANWLGNLGKNLVCDQGATYLTDAFTINAANSPALFNCYGAGFKLRTAAAQLLLIENPQNATNFSGLSMFGGRFDANSLGTNVIRIHGAQRGTSGTSLHMADIELQGQTANNCGLNLVGEPSFGVYSNQFDHITSIGGVGIAACTQSINNSGQYYVQTNTLNKLELEGGSSTSGGLFIDYANNTFNDLHVENLTAGACVNISHSLQNKFTGGHLESCLLSAVDTSFVGTANSLGIIIDGTRTTGAITGINGLSNNALWPACGGFCQAGVTDAFNVWYLQTQGIGFSGSAVISNTLNWGTTGHLAIGGVDVAQIVASGMKLSTTTGLSFGGLTPIADSINYSASNGLSFAKAGATRAQITDGLQLGSPTGGDKGTGTLNAANNIYVNNAPVLTAVPATTCTNQFLTAIATTGTGTCTTDTLASAQHANQGTTTTVLHGNAAGNPSFGAVSLTADVSGVLPTANGGCSVPASFSPTDQSGATLTFTGVSVQFMQCGNNVYVYGTLTYPSTANGSVAIISLPVAVPNQNYAKVPGVLMTNQGASGVLIWTVPNTSTAKFTSTASNPNAPETNANLSTSTIWFSLVYPAS